MYTVSRKIHHKYGNIIELLTDDNGKFNNPNSALLKAKLDRRLWMEEDNSKVRLFIRNQVMTLSRAEQWADVEYKSLPKCYLCRNILDENVFNHRLNDNLFCSQICSDKDYNIQMDKILDEEDIEYL